MKKRNGWKYRIQRLRVRLKKSLTTAPLVATIAVGLTSGIMGAMVSVSFAALIFSGRLSPYVSVGVGLFLYSAFVLRSLVAVTSSFPGLVADTDALPCAIFALMATDIARQIPPDSSELLPTILAAIATTTLVSGTFLLLLGRLRVGELVRFIPYPVVGGFAAGTGWLLVRGAVEVMAGIPFGWRTTVEIFQFDVFVHWLPGALLGIGLFLGLQYWGRFILVPAGAIATVGLFYLVAIAFGVSISTLDTGGWLLGAFPDGRLWQPLAISELLRVRWSLIFSQSLSILAIASVSAVSILLTSSSLELVAHQEIDLDRELKSAGLANLVSGMGGGMVGYHILPDSALGARLGVNTPILGIVSALVCGGALLLEPSWLSFVPKFALGELLVFLGTSLLFEWVWQARRKLPPFDYTIVLIILVAINALGLLAGAIVGLIFSTILFAIEYGQISVVKYALSGDTTRSNVVRSPQQEQILQAKGNRIYILKLQNFIFFGTANKLLNRVRERIQERHQLPLDFVAIDFQSANGIDSSAALSFTKLEQMADRYNFTLVFAAVKPEIGKLLQQREGGEENGRSISFSNFDLAIEWCEDRLLEGEIESSDPETLCEQLARSFLPRDRVFQFTRYLDPLKVEAGEFICKQGDPSDGLYFLEAGRVSVCKEINQNIERLRTFSSGTILGEMGLYGNAPRSASIVVDRPSCLYFLSRSSFEKMERDDPQLAALLHKFIVRLLADRLRYREAELKYLLQ